MKKYIVLIIGLLTFFKGIAQEANWKTDILKDGKITVKSKIVTQKVNNEEKNVIYYMVETIADFNLAKAEAFMRNSANYKLFLESVQTSNEVKKITPNSWITYLYFDNSFPISDIDCVQKFELVKTTNGFSVTGKATPNEYEMKDVSRIYLYDVVYKFERVTDKKTKLIITAAFCSGASIPQFLLKRWLPKGPSELATRLVNEVSK
jgi:hypothetical protein